MAKSTEKIPIKKNSPPRQPTTGRTRLWKALLALLLLLLPLALLLAIVLGAKRVFFVGNDRFMLKHVSVERGRFWRGRENVLAQRIGLAPGTNLFALDYRKLRERLATIPSIESAEVVPVLPDTIELRLIERIPRAAIGNPNSPWVVDENNIVIPRAESLAAENLRLPVISGIPPAEVRLGAKLERLGPAMELIMATVRGFPQIRISWISVADKEKLLFTMRYRDSRQLTVTLPTSNRGVNFMLSALQSAILDAWRFGDERSNFNLSYEGRVVLK